MRITFHQARMLVRGWLVLVALLLSVLGAMAAEAGWRAVSGDAETPPRHVIIPAAYQPDGRAADLTLLAPTTPPPSGTTGTIALPPLPLPAAAAEALAAAEPGVVAARPFSVAYASALDQARAIRCLTDAIYYEAASEPDEGQRAVAQVVLNRVRHPAFPATVCGVIYQGSERGGCQFSFACDGAMARVPSRTGWARAARVAAAALAGYVYAPVGLATHYHTYAVTPVWNRALVMTDAVGAHFFHRWKGYWGTAAAFTQAYRGGEPMPGPHARIGAPLILAAASAPTATFAAPVLPVTPPSTIQPAFTQTSIATPAPAAPEDHLPPASQVLDRWKDSGKPL